MSLVVSGSERWRRLCGCRCEQVTLRPEMGTGIRGNLPVTGCGKGDIVARMQVDI